MNVYHVSECLPSALLSEIMESFDNRMAKVKNIGLTRPQCRNGANRMLLHYWWEYKKWSNHFGKPVVSLKVKHTPPTPQPFYSWILIQEK